MEDWIWIVCFLPLFIVLWTEHENTRKEKQRRVLQIIQKNKEKGTKQMYETCKKFIGKECVITTMNATILATVEAVEDKWLLLRAEGNAAGEGDMVNIDYVIRIRECPRNKKGKKKLIYS